MSSSIWHYLLERWFDSWGPAGQPAGRKRPPGPGRRGPLRPCLEVLEGRTLPSSTVFWTGMSTPSDPNWSDPANWSSGQVPQDGDTLVFTQSESHLSTSTVDAGFTASSVTLVVDNTWGGTVNLAHSLALTGDSEWSGGGNIDFINLAGNTLTNDGTLTVNPPGGNAGALVLELIGNDFFEGGNDSNLGGTLVNRGTIVQEGGGNLQLGDSVRIDNQAGATYDFASDGNIIGGQPGVQLAMSNAGTVEKTGGTGTSSIQVAFSNLDGTLAADSGTLQLASAYPGGASTGGTFDAGQGGVLDLTGGGDVNVFTGSYTGSGLGTVLFGSGAFVVGAGGATLDFPPGLLQWAGGMIGGRGSINLQGNTLTNTGFVTLNDPTGNTFQLFANDVFRGGSDFNMGGTLVNGGTIVQQGGGEFQLVDKVQIDNQARATYDFAADGFIDSNAPFDPVAMSNAGTVDKTGGTGTSSIQVAFSNLNGTLAADSGTLQLACGADTGGSSTGGTLNAAQGAVLDLTGGRAVNTFTGSYSGSGQGTVLIGDGAFVVGASGASLDFPAGLLQWSGSVNGSDINLQGNALTNTGFLTLSNTPGTTDVLVSESGHEGDLGGTLINRGTIVQQGDGEFELIDGVQIDNQAGAIYDFASDGSIIVDGAGGSLSNAGTVDKAGGTGTTPVGATFSNTGVVDVESGTLQFPGGLPLDGPAALAGSAAGTLSVQGDVVGDTTNAAQFAPQEKVVLAGPGASSPQLLEVMSQDLGDVAAGFVHNFAYDGTLEVAAGNQVRLVDDARNSPGTGPEALYVDTLVVPAGATLDLNGLHVYVRSDQVQGTVIGGSISVLPPPELMAAGQTISATAGQPFSGVVATVTDTYSGVTAGGLQATIAWGDGHTSAGTLTDDGGGTFGVSGTNTYTQAGAYTVSVTVQDAANNQTATAQDPATVQPRGSVSATGQAISATAGQPFSGVVATVTDTFSGVTAGDLQATIAWGDGHTSAGTLTDDGGGTFSVSGTNTYPRAGSYTVSVTVQDTANNQTATAQGPATVQTAHGHHRRHGHHRHHVHHAHQGHGARPRHHASG
jgi:hypothetical protein